MTKGDKDNLQSVLYECVAAGMPELDTDIKKARGALIGMEYSTAGGACIIFIRNLFISTFR